MERKSETGKDETLVVKMPIHTQHCVYLTVLKLASNLLKIRNVVSSSHKLHLGTSNKRLIVSRQYYVKIWIINYETDDN